MDGLQSVQTPEVTASGPLKFIGTGRRKTSVARVRLVPGQGNIFVNAKAAEAYFVRKGQVDLIRQPLLATATNNRFDVYVNVSGGGPTGQMGAVIHGIARALVKADADLRGTLSKAGYLTRDSRMVERKKYGQAGARRRFQFSKR